MTPGEDFDLLDVRYQRAMARRDHAQALEHLNGMIESAPLRLLQQLVRERQEVNVLIELADKPLRRWFYGAGFRRKVA